MTPAERPRRRVLAGALAALSLGLLGLTACDAGSADTRQTAETSSASPDGRGPEAYVALGDSYAAAPFVPTTDVAAGCFRSNGNYPSLVSEALGPTTFVDVSCSGADSGDLVGPQRVGDDGEVPPQLRAMRRDADLVTVGIGGNDGNLFTQLVCGFTRQRFARCEVASAPDVASILTRTRQSVAAALRLVVRRAAPDALVVLVSYPRLVDPTRTCPALPLKGDQLAQVAQVEKQLHATQRAAAREAGVEFLDLWPASRGHELCSDDPWVNGEETDRSRALAYHPFAAEQEAVADLVVERWREHAS